MLTEPGDHAKISAPSGAETGADHASVAVAVRRARWSTWLVLAVYLLAALAVTWRLWVDPASRTVAGNPDDADLFAWYMRYAANSIAHWQLPALVTPALNAPSGINLMWNSSLLLPSILLAPVTLLFGAQVSLTVLTTLGFAGSAAAMFWVLRRWQVSESAAAIAGAVYGFSPALLQSALGHYDLQFAVLPPLIVDTMLRIAIGPDRRAVLAERAERIRRARRKESEGSGTAGSVGSAGSVGPVGAVGSLGDEGEQVTRWRPEVRTGIWLGLLVTAELFVSEELTLTTVLTGALLIVILGTGFWPQVRARLEPTLAGAAVAVGVTLATAGWALWVQFFGPLTQNSSPFLPDFYVNDLSGFITPSGSLLFHTSASAATAAAYRGQPPEYLAYLGWPLVIVLIVAAAAFWMQPVIRAFGASAIVLALLSLGGHPLVSGVDHVGVDLPWRWLQYLPLAGSVLPDRFSIVLDGLAAVLLALVLDQVRQRLRLRDPGGGQSRLQSPVEPEARLRDLGGGQSRLQLRPRLRAAAATGLAVLVCLPLVPLPLPPALAEQLPAGWTAAFAALHLPDGARVLVVPVPEVHLTEAMRWQADSGQQYSLIGGYFIGPAWDGHAYIDGNGLSATSVYLNELWASGLRPGTPLALAAAGAGLGPPPLEPPSTAQVHADVSAWQPQAVVAVTRPGSPLARYLTGLFGKPAVSTATVLAWRPR
ncbi:MAG TPA: hypothetical protein VN767_12540 [Streptosporangiaceae bacterium]|nr:hypothetical protein [Streptosporangiaceae bacterium]